MARTPPTLDSRWTDPVIEAYKKDVDRTLLRENLKLTPDERLRRLEEFMRSIRALRGAARRHA